MISKHELREKRILVTGIAGNVGAAGIVCIPSHGVVEELAVDCLARVGCTCCIVSSVTSVGLHLVILVGC